MLEEKIKFGFELVQDEEYIIQFDLISYSKQSIMFAEKYSGVYTYKDIFIVEDPPYTDNIYYLFINDNGDKLHLCNNSYSNTYSFATQLYKNISNEYIPRYQLEDKSLSFYEKYINIYYTFTKEVYVAITACFEYRARFARMSCKIYKNKENETEYVLK